MNPLNHIDRTNLVLNGVNESNRSTIDGSKIDELADPLSISPIFERNGLLEAL